ncbi:cobalamin biosynthesis protein CbiD [Acidilutibacter cellobiosedens]|jgi:cobalt-precorrin-5B (C1)-methyltransferase|uniref:Cobalt-precorrin-5B C(1)-methyltransferase n=1 Tax=Acidilutibacter cellobiosedens TaxID=2507161 RepID=A0A410Q8U1_9FIRM|nr:cobalt-precorrin-5B (C(1))-methyltransferase CbiD [Acidilutibacter cellobiosedens]QAT60390.1 cobalamin biosynthesis protein CbiD [Acidilutibacter cellobiosedens]
MLEKYIIKDGKKLRYGYTTGSCAAGAAKAAAEMLFFQRTVDNIEIDTPKGWKLNLKVEEPSFDSDKAVCCIVKDGGDDPDITNGLKIYARIAKNSEGKINITGGIGIGVVTKPGLSVPVGEYAINPVPREMITKEVRKVIPDKEGVDVKIYAPEGVEAAKKTFNGKLGIEGGISIIGTSGIVEPMSEEALKSSLELELSMLKEQGVKRIIFSPGNYGRDFGIDYGLDEKLIVKISNYVGFMIDKAVEYNMEEVLFIGHIGKLVKVAAGIFNTHSKIADGRLETLAANCALLGASQELVKKIMESNTTEEAVDYISADNMDKVFDFIAQKISKKCEERSYGRIKFGTLIFSLNHGMLGVCDKGLKMLEEFKI